MNIQIPDPCPESWENMIPGEEGRFCNTCCKTVVDFTGMSPQAISSYLVQHRSGQLCGRFHKHQMEETPLSLIKTVYRSGLQHVRKMAAIFLLIFICSQNTSAQTKPAADSVKKESMMLGRVICPPKKRVPEKKTNKDASKQPAGQQQPPASTSGTSIDPVYTMGLVAPAKRRK